MDRRFIPGMIVAAISCVCLFSSCSREEETTAASPALQPVDDPESFTRSVFFVADAQPTETVSSTHPMKLGLRYKILLKRGEFSGTVPENTTFQKGDHFRLYVEGNATGHLYLIHKGTSGRSIMLFPDRRKGSAVSRIVAHEEMVLPASSWLGFDGLPGIEEIYVLYSHEKIDELEAPSESAESDWMQTIQPLIQRHQKMTQTNRLRSAAFVETGLPVTLPDVSSETDRQANQSTTTYAAMETIDPQGMLIHVIQLNRQ